MWAPVASIPSPLAVFVTGSAPTLWSAEQTNFHVSLGSRTLSLSRSPMLCVASLARASDVFPSTWITCKLGLVELHLSSVTQPPLSVVLVGLPVLLGCVSGALALVFASV